MSFEPTVGSLVLPLRGSLNDNSDLPAKGKIRESLARDRLAVRFLLSGNEHVELAGQKTNGKLLRRPENVLTLTEALQRHHEFTYFSPFDRARKGCRISDLASEGTNVWIDIDLLTEQQVRALTPAELGDRKLYAAAHLIAELGRLGVTPALVIDSGGKGIQAHLKLASSVTRDRVVALNTRLKLLLRGDHCQGANSLLRLPGGINELTGQPARILHFKPTTTDPELLDRVLPSLPQQASSMPAGRPGNDLEISVGVQDLNRQALAYLREQPAYPWSNERFRSRSEAEQSIISQLCCQGWSDQRIEAFANVHFPKQREQRSRTYITCSIESGRSWLAEHGVVTSKHGGEPLHIRAKRPDPTQPRLRDGKILQELHKDGMTTSQLTESIINEYGCSKRHALRRIKNLRANQLLEYVQDPGDARRRLHYKTPKCHRELERLRTVHWMLTRTSSGRLRMEALHGERTSVPSVDNTQNVPTHSHIPSLSITSFLMYRKVSPIPFPKERIRSSDRDYAHAYVPP